MNGIEQALASGIEGGTIILYPALGELIGERAGVVNLGLEGCMLAGALAAYAAALGHRLCLARRPRRVRRRRSGRVSRTAGSCVTRQADQLASGLVLWFLAIGLTSVLGSLLRQQVGQPAADRTASPGSDRSRGSARSCSTTICSCMPATSLSPSSGGCCSEPGSVWCCGRLASGPRSSR